MAPNLIKSKEVRANHFDSHKSTMAMPGKPLAKGSISSYQRKDLELIADELLSIWEHLKADSPVYRKVERSTTSDNAVEVDS